MNLRIVGFGYVCAVSAGRLAGLAEMGSKSWTTSGRFASSTRVPSAMVEVGLNIAPGRESEIVLEYAT
jgi:hypothetical protein